MLKTASLPGTWDEYEQAMSCYAQSADIASNVHLIPCPRAGGRQKDSLWCNGQTRKAVKFSANESLIGQNVLLTWMDVSDRSYVAYAGRQGMVANPGENHVRSRPSTGWQCCDKCTRYTGRPSPIGRNPGAAASPPCVPSRRSLPLSHLLSHQEHRGAICCSLLASSPSLSRA